MFISPWNRQQVAFVYLFIDRTRFELTYERLLFNNLQGIEFVFSVCLLALIYLGDRVVCIDLWSKTALFDFFDYRLVLFFIQGNLSFGALLVQPFKYCLFILFVLLFILIIIVKVISAKCFLNVFKLKIISQLSKSFNRICLPISLQIPIQNGSKRPSFRHWQSIIPKVINYFIDEPSWYKHIPIIDNPHYFPQLHHDVLFNLAKHLLIQLQPSLIIKIPLVISTCIFINNSKYLLRFIPIKCSHIFTSDPIFGTVFRY